MTLECLNYESWKNVVPAYFEKALQSKYARDEGSQEMMEIVRDSIYYDFGYVFAGVIDGIAGTMAGVIDGTDVASAWQRNEKSHQKKLERILKYFKEE